MASAENTPLRTVPASGLPPLARRLRALVLSLPWGLVVLILIGLGLRLALWRNVHPAVMNPDAVTYLVMATYDLYTDPVRPSGYSMFLIALHAISSNVDFTIWAQHLMGIATGLIFYATARALGAPRWAGVIAAAPALLSLDQIVYEHALMSDGLFTFLIAVALYCGVRALEEPRMLFDAITTRSAWIIGAAILFGLCVWVRAVGLPVALFVPLFFGLAIAGSFWKRVWHAVLAAATLAAVVLGYFQLNYAATDNFELIPASGWGIYSRTAPFADCDRFEPPEGTRRLCEDTPPEKRPIPDAYGWSKTSPAIRGFGLPPAGNDEVGAFGRAVVLGQPFDYLEVVATDVGKYFGFGLGPYDLGGTAMLFLPGDEQRVMRRVNDYYHYETFATGDGADTLVDLQEIVRVHGQILLAALVLAIAGAALARGRLRAAIVLLTGIALLLLVIPPASAVFNFRYALPANGALVTAGAIGLWVVVRRIAERGNRPTEAPAAES